MRMKITQRAFDALKPMARVYEAVDSEVQGFAVRVMPSGAKSYSVRYRLPNGAQTRMKIGLATQCTLAQAKDQARAILADVVQGEDPAAKRKANRAHTLQTFLDQEYGPWLVANRKAGKAMLACLKRSCKPFMNKKLSELTAWGVEKWKSEHQKRGALVTANRSLAYLKSCLNRAVDWGHLESNPIARVKRFKEDPNAKIRYLDSEEEKRLMAALASREDRLRQERANHNLWCQERGYPEYPDLRQMAFADHLKPLVLLSLHTGMRRGELFSLQWADVSFDRATLTICGATAKSGKTRHVPLNAVCLNTLKGWRDQSEDGAVLVFSSPQTGKKFDNVDTAWQGLLKEAKITGFRWHDMRHHFASRLVMAGVDLNTVRELLGHSDIKMTLRYSHLAPEHKAAAVRLLEPENNIVSLHAEREARA